MTTTQLTLLPPPPVRSVDSHRLLISPARRAETQLVREYWKRRQDSEQLLASRLRHHPHSAPSSSLLRKARPLDYGDRIPTDHHEADKRLQFPHLEAEVNKRNLIERLPYFVPVNVEPKPKMDYPCSLTSYNYVFFAEADREKPRSQTAKTMSRRFFVHPEWSSERVSWVRFHHKSNPDRFRFSWM